MDALKFEYPDYEQLNKGTEGAKRKRVVSVLSRQAARMVKEDEKILKKRKSSPEPKVAGLKKSKAKSLEPKVTEEEKENLSVPSIRGTLFYNLKTLYTYDVSRPHGERHPTPPRGQV
jgi:hypothetical protein